MTHDEMMDENEAFRAEKESGKPSQAETPQPTPASTPAGDAAVASALAAALTPAQRRALFGELWSRIREDLGGGEAESDEPEGGEGEPETPQSSDFQLEKLIEAEHENKSKIDPLPRLTKIGGLSLEPLEKWHLAQGIFIAGQLVETGIIPLESPTDDFAPSFWDAARIISRALFAVRHEQRLVD